MSPVSRPLMTMGHIWARRVRATMTEERGVWLHSLKKMVANSWPRILSTLCFSSKPANQICEPLGNSSASIPCRGESRSSKLRLHGGDHDRSHALVLDLGLISSVKAQTSASARSGDRG